MNMIKALAELNRMAVSELQQRYGEEFGETPRSRHREYLIRRIAWRMQATAEGGLSAEALEKAGVLADVALVRVTAPRERTAAPLTSRPNDSAARAHADPRIPPVGTVITRKYRGRALQVKVVADGFEHEGEQYTTLSATAKAITGSHMSGFRFFGLESSV